MHGGDTEESVGGVRGDQEKAMGAEGGQSFFYKLGPTGEMDFKEICERSFHGAAEYRVDSGGLKSERDGEKSLLRSLMENNARW